jgi:hypothetical protein
MLSTPFFFSTINCAVYGHAHYLSGEYLCGRKRWKAVRLCMKIATQRPKAYTYVYPLPGEVLAKAEPIIFDIQSGNRIEVRTSLFSAGARSFWHSQLASWQIHEALSREKRIAFPASTNSKSEKGSSVAV